MIAINIYDISRKAGVSIATVSRVINESSNVSEETRKKVLAAIEESGYTPNAFARGLGLNTMKTVGILCANSSDTYLAQAIYYIEQDLRQHGYDSLLCCTGYNIDAKKNCLNLLISKKVDAVILVGSNYVEPNEKNNDYIIEAAKKIPVMLINGVINAPNVYSTVCDDFAGVYEITENFIKNGHKNILYLYNSCSYSGMKKMEGFRSALKNNSLPVNEEYIQFIKNQNPSVHEIKDFVSKISARGISFDGIIACDDIIAIGALKYAKEAGMKIPDDVFITGYNNFSVAECCDPELTSVDNKLEAICHHCVSTLMGVFAGKSMPKKTVFSAEIVERGTTLFNI